MTTDVQDSVEHLAQLHREHDRTTSLLQRVANSVTSRLGQPVALCAVASSIAAWVCGNYIALRLGFTALDESPFPDLAFVLTIAAVLIALLILTTQQHQSQLADRRALLTLEIAILSEKKIAKVISLLEEQRAENPLLASRVDEQADAMAQAVDPQESIDSLEQVGLIATDAG